MEITAVDALAHLAETGTPPDDAAIVFRVSAGLQEWFDRIRTETLPFLAAGGSELQFVHGPYGRGKTHLLKALTYVAREQGFVTAYVDCADDESPFRSLRSTYRAIAANLEPPFSLESINSFGSPGLTGAVEAQFGHRSPASQRALIDRLRTDRSLSADFRNLVVAYCTWGLLALGDEELSDDLQALLTATPTRRVVVGELYRAHAGLPRPLGKLTRRNAGAWLRSLLSLPSLLGYSGLLVCFDETETILKGQGPRQKQARLAHIRTFVDHLATGAYEGCAVYYAAAEDLLDSARADLGALAQRIDRMRLPHTGRSRNPRAVWVDLDELTVPGPHDSRFFEELGQSIHRLGSDAGMDPSHAPEIRDLVRDRAWKYAEDIDEGQVRRFVKEIAANVALKVR